MYITAINDKGGHDIEVENGWVYMKDWGEVKEMMVKL